MKKKYLLLPLLIALSMQLFGATISVARRMPSQLDLSFANSIEFLPIRIYAPKRGDTFEQDQKAIGNKFISALSDYQKDDGKFIIINGKSDISIQVSFTDFNVKDNGVTLTQDVEGETVVIKDEWTRQVSAMMEVMIIKSADNSVISKNEYKLFDTTSSYSPKAELKEPQYIVENQLRGFVYQIATLIFDIPYNQPMTIMDSKSKDKQVKEKMKSAKKLLSGKNLDYEAAKAIYKEIYESTDDIAAGYNYSRMLQISKDFDAAEELLNKFTAANPKDKTFKKALEDLEKDREETKILDSRKK